MIADNRLAEINSWDDQLLGEKLKLLSDPELDIDIESIGFDYGENEQRVLALERVGEEEEDDALAESQLPTMRDCVTQLRRVPANEVLAHVA